MHEVNTHKYKKGLVLTEHQILEKAAEIIANKYLRGDTFCNPQATQDFLKYKLANNEREVFAVLLLDNQHRLIEYQELFFGTIDSANIYPREVVKVCIQANASAVIFAYSHPSGVAEPSQADRRITERLKDALALIDVRTLDHIVVGEDCVSFAERGWI